MNDDTTIETNVDMEPTMETPENKPDLSSPEAQAILKTMVDEQLAGMKENMNKMSAQRDEAMKKAVELEEGVKAAKLEKLEAEGKTSEALQMKLDEALARVNSLTSINTTLTRDHAVDRILGEQDFRNVTAKEMAKTQIVGQLKQDEEGGWVHATGASIGDFVQTFAKDEENAFLFKPKQSTGAASMQQAVTPGQSDANLTPKDSLDNLQKQLQGMDLSQMGF